MSRPVGSKNKKTIERMAANAPMGISPNSVLPAFRTAGAMQAPPELTNAQKFVELGSSGLTRFGGSIYEEFLAELKLKGKYAVYREMRDNSPVVAAILFAIEMAIRRVKYYFETENDKEDELRDFLNSCLDDMSMTFQDTLTQIMSMLQYGFSLFEIVYKVRRGMDKSPESQFNDGRIGWRKWLPLAQDTLAPGKEWIFDETGGVQGINQIAPPDYILRTLPIEKLLLFRPSVQRNNPEGQALRIDTPIPTPNGWSTIGNLNVGDCVYDEQGKIRYVVAKSEIWKDRPVYEIKFTTGHTIVADENHLWSVTTCNDRANNKTARTLTTKEISEWINRETHGPFFSTGRAPVLDAPLLPLPIDPYLLGYWLGDGHTASGCISVCSRDFSSFKEQIGNIGLNCSYDGKMQACVPGLKVILRAIGVLNNKHIPPAYLRASKEQRLALLQGLMDTDGSSSSGKDHASYFCNSNVVLIEQVSELIRSLGGQPRLRIMSRAGQVHIRKFAAKPIIQRKDMHAITFFLDKPVHRLQRKLDGQSLEFSSRVSAHYIESVKEVGTADTICIEVDSPSHLYLAGKGMTPTHNSILRAVYTPWYFAKNLMEVEGIAAERMGTGLPVMYMGSDTIKSGAKSDVELAKQIVRDTRADEQMGVVIPYPKMTSDGKGMLFELVSPPSRGMVDFDGVINRYEKRMCMAALAQFIMLGMDQTGSYALSKDQSDLFVLSISAWADSIAQIINRHALPRLLKMNPFTYDQMPQLLHSEVAVPDLNALANYINTLVGSNLLIPDSNLEVYLRDAAKLPKKEPGAPTIDDIRKQKDEQAKMLLEAQKQGAEDKKSQEDTEPQGGVNPTEEEAEEVKDEAPKENASVERFVDTELRDKFNVLLGQYVYALKEKQPEQKPDNYTIPVNIAFPPQTINVTSPQAPEMKTENFIQVPEQAAPQISVNVPMPVVNVAAPNVNVSQPDVKITNQVNVPEQPTPVVNVSSAPANVTVTEKTGTTEIIERDQAGRPTKITKRTTFETKQ